VTAPPGRRRRACLVSMRPPCAGGSYRAACERRGGLRVRQADGADHGPRDAGRRGALRHARAAGARGARAQARARQPLPAHRAGLGFGLRTLQHAARLRARAARTPRELSRACALRRQPAAIGRPADAACALVRSGACAKALTGLGCTLGRGVRALTASKRSGCSSASLAPAYRLETSHHAWSATSAASSRNACVHLMGLMHACT